MDPRSKIIVILNLLWSGFFETNATFRSASTDLGHASVEADRNVAFVSKNPLQSKFKITIIAIMYIFITGDSIKTAYAMITCMR